MDHIGNLVKIENYRSSKKPSSTSSESGNKSEDDRRRSSIELLSVEMMGHVWKRMLSIYGHKWESHLGEVLDERGRLSDSARTWQRGLAGLTVEQIKIGFETLIFKHHAWPPSLPEFRELCLSGGHSSKPPSLDEAVSVLALASSRCGSLVDRYRHPLILAIAGRVDMFALRSAKIFDARRWVKPVYDELIRDGWPEWPGHAHDIPLAIGHDKPVNRELGRQSISRLREVLRHGGQALG